jgi:hypothetical protein
VHVRSTHEGERHYCTEEGCGKSFTQQSSLTVSIARSVSPPTDSHRQAS